MRLFRTIITFSLAALVFMSGSSFLVGFHYCGGEVQKIAFLSKAPGCEKEKQLPPCHRPKTPPCCEDEVVFHEGQGFKHTTENIHIELPQTGTLAIPVVIAEVFSRVVNEVGYTYYDPPLPIPDLTVSLQVFRI